MWLFECSRWWMERWKIESCSWMEREKRSLNIRRKSPCWRWSVDIITAIADFYDSLQMGHFGGHDNVDSDNIIHMHLGCMSKRHPTLADKQCARHPIATRSKLSKCTIIIWFSLKRFSFFKNTITHKGGMTAMKFRRKTNSISTWIYNSLQWRGRPLIEWRQF